MFACQIKDTPQMKLNIVALCDPLSKNKKKKKTNPTTYFSNNFFLVPKNDLNSKFKKLERTSNDQ